MQIQATNCLLIVVAYLCSASFKELAADISAAAPGESGVAPTANIAFSFGLESLSQSRRPPNVIFERPPPFPLTPELKYRKVLPVLAAGYLSVGRRKQDRSGFITDPGALLDANRTRGKQPVENLTVEQSHVPTAELRPSQKKEKKQNFSLHCGKRVSTIEQLNTIACENQSPTESSLNTWWNLPSPVPLRHFPVRPQRARKHTPEHPAAFLIQPPILDPSKFHTGGLSTYVSSDSTENFHVGMPSLLEEHKNIELLPASLQHAIAYLAVTKFPKERTPRKNYLLPPQAAQCANRVTLVLDMDETLMHCSIQPLQTEPDFLVHFADTNLLGHVYVRPFAKLFLDLASQICEIVLFTASTQAYADQVLAQLDPEKRFVQHRLYRQHCTVINGGHVKDLRLLGRDVAKVVLADNSPISMALQPDNGIIVSTWTTDYDDKELMDLLMLLQSLPVCIASSRLATRSGINMIPQHIATLNDVQEFLRSRYGFRRWINRVRPPLDPL